MFKNLLSNEYFKFRILASYYFDYPLIPPVSASLSVTNKCNGKCIYCHIGNSKFKNSDLSTDAIKKHISDLYEFGVRELVFSGGEPFIREDLIELIRFASARGFQIRLITNGTLLDEEDLDTLGKLALRRISISVDTLDPLLHEQIKGTKFDCVYRTLEKMSEFKKKFPETEVALFTIIHKFNIWKLSPLIEFAKKYDFINLFRALEPDPNIQERIDSIWPDQTDINRLKSEICEIIQKKMKGYAISNSVEWFRKLPEYYDGTLKRLKKCFATIIRVNIDENFDIRPCWLLPSVGNLQEWAIDRIWFSSSMKKYRRTIRLKKCPGCMWPLHSQNIVKRFFK